MQVSTVIAWCAACTGGAPAGRGRRGVEEDVQQHLLRDERGQEHRQPDPAPGQQHGTRPRTNAATASTPGPGSVAAAGQVRRGREQQRTAAEQRDARRPRSRTAARARVTALAARVRRQRGQPGVVRLELGVVVAVGLAVEPLAGLRGRCGSSPRAAPPRAAARAGRRRPRRSRRRAAGRPGARPCRSGRARPTTSGRAASRPTSARSRRTRGRPA